MPRWRWRRPTRCGPPWTAGGAPIEITPQLAEPASARLTVRTVLDGVEVPARLSLRGPDGHPLIPDTGITRLDGQSGMPFVYSPGRLTVPVLLDGQAVAGRGVATVTVRAARGLFKQARAELALAAGESREVTLDLGQQPGWDAAAAGYVSGDHHLHLNYAAQPMSGLVLYPHFQKAVVPGWLDKSLRWRHGATHFLDNMVVLAPDPDWVRTLPNSKLPDRTDFTRYGTDLQSRVKAWGQGVAASRRMADEFGEWLAMPDPSQVESL